MVAQIKCPECGSTHVWKVGSVPTRSGPKLRYKCVECARSFYVLPDKPKKRVRKPK